jgi:hypothetical protein
VSRLRQRAWLALVAAGAAAGVLVAARAGVGLSTDSVAYLAEARSLRHGDGLTLPAGLHAVYVTEDRAAARLDAERVPAAHFPPLLPAVLAAAGPSADGRWPGPWLNAALLAASAVAVALMVAGRTGSRPAAALAAGAVALAPAVLRTHAMVWSEPLFLALGLWGLLGLARYLTTGRTRALVGGGLALGGAWLTRYAGVALVAAGVAALLLRAPRPRWRPVAALAALAAGPMAVFAATVVAPSPAGSGYTLGVHRPAAAVVDQGWDSLRAWVLPAGLPSAAALVAVAAAAPLLGVVAARLARHHGTGSPSAPDLTLRHLPLVLGAALTAYAAVLAASLTLVAEPVSLEERVLVPAYVLAVPLVAVAAAPALRHRFAGPLVGTLAAAVLLVVAGAGTAVLGTGERDYPSFTDPAWVGTGAAAAVARVPPGTPIWSNFPEAVYVATGRPARLLPAAASGERLRRLAADVGGGRAVVVYYLTGSRPGLPAPGDLATALGVAPAWLERVLMFARR